MKLNKRILFYLLAITCITPLAAQDKQGNIVQYFGKENISDFDTAKNQILHTFTEGLMVSENRVSFNSSTIQKELLVYNHIFSDTFKIFEGKPEKLSDNSDQSTVWTRVTVNEKQEFSNQELRTGYLYTEFESSIDQNVILDASGHTMVFVNGIPHEGDHYDFGYSMIHVKLKKGKNTFLFTGGRFPRIRARLLKPLKPIQITDRDRTLPDLLVEEPGEYIGAIRILNASDKVLTNGKIVCDINGVTIMSDLPTLPQLYTRKVTFKIQTPDDLNEEQTLTVKISVFNSIEELLDTHTISINTKSNLKHHKKTFTSNIDGSVQYYSVAPSTGQGSNQALFLSLHGASVEAVNQARAYKQKDWGHIVAPTNRRPYGFAWEDWGRIDALEVLKDASNYYKPDPKRIYLTGHSMGGHGTWYLGATYPDFWGGIAPAAGYPDLLLYRKSFTKRLVSMSDDELKERGITREDVNRMMQSENNFSGINKKMYDMIFRAGNSTRTLTLKRNYLHYPVYILHGEKDTVVPTFIAREMNDTLKTFHPNYTYYEYPDGTHWYGDHSMDWGPIFDMFKANTIKRGNEIDTLEFYTASPGVSSKSNFIEILQQEEPLELSSFKFIRNKVPSIATSNVQLLRVDYEEMGLATNKIMLDGQKVKVNSRQKVIIYKKVSGSWVMQQKIDPFEKSPLRAGGFKDAFNHNFVMVYGTTGSAEETKWNFNKARFDAEKFYYRANGNVEIIADSDFDAKEHEEHNVIIYGNNSNNSAWSSVLGQCPILVSKGKLTFGKTIYEGDNYGIYFIYPKKNSSKNSVGVLAYTGLKGGKATYSNNYLVNGTTFPDFLMFSDSVVKEGIPAVIGNGFFDNEWKLNPKFYELRPTK